MVSVGQIWEYRRDPKISWRVPDNLLYDRNAVYHSRIAWKILRGEIRGDDFFWHAKVIRDEDKFFGVDLIHEFAQEAFDKQERFRLIYDPAQDNGVYCGQCGRFYPYASWKPDFKCWGCRNGF